MKDRRFVIHDSSVEEYVESLENKNTQGKTKRDVRLLNDFLRGEKKEERELSAITPEDLDRYLTEFIRSVRRKDGGEYEPSSLRSLLASVERYLKKNRSAKRTCVGLDLLLFHSVRVLVLNISIRELKYYQ